MKLRNKKTGEIGRLYFDHQLIDPKTGAYAIVIQHRDKLGYGAFANYFSLAELNEEWEDYKPKEPLIKDEKNRKAVRAWAEANDIERVWHEYSACWLRGDGLIIELENEVVELEQGNYSIAELCGEESPEPLEPSFIDLDERIKEKVASEKLYKGENDMHLVGEEEE